MFEQIKIHPNDEAFRNDYIVYICQKFFISRKYKPKRIIEIGVRAGYSAYGFLTAVPNAEYFGFDAENGTHGGERGPYMDWAKDILSIFPNVKYKKIDTQTIDSLGEIKADFIHVDGDHSYQGVLHDLELVFNHHLDEHGVILVDDIDRIPDVALGVKKFLNNHPNVKYKYLETFNGDVLIGDIADILFNDISIFREVEKKNKSIISLSENKVDKKIYIIDSFKKKKLVEYLQGNEKVLIRFGHGWGDTQMFMPIFYQLKKIYSKVIFDLYLENGQEEIFNSVKSPDMSQYDFVFSLNFPMSEGSNLTKSEKCCIEEIGIEPISKLATLSLQESPIVLVHFQGTCLPEGVNCSLDISEKIWEEIKQFGKIPFECHFCHNFHNPVNNKYQFIDNSARNYKANLKNLIGLVQNSFAFIGVASGPLVTALSIMPDRTLYLEKHHHIKNYTYDNVDKINILNYKDGNVLSWLENLTNKNMGK